MNSTNFTRRTLLVSALLATAYASASCGNNSVSNEESARRAYLGLDRAVDKALNLAMQGYNAPHSGANIMTQTAMGDVSGTLVADGQVSSGTGSSSNSEVRLTTTFNAYEDNVRTADDAGALHIIYSAVPTTTTLSLSLRSIPNGTFDGTLMQTLHMTGDLQGDVTLNLTFAGQIRALAGGPTGAIERTANTTTITGTAASTYGTYNVNITR